MPCHRSRTCPGRACHSTVPSLGGKGRGEEKHVEGHGSEIRTLVEVWRCAANGGLERWQAEAEKSLAWKACLCEAAPGAPAHPNSRRGYAEIGADVSAALRSSVTC